VCDRRRATCAPVRIEFNRRAVVDDEDI
jgi:hypothetical protein